MQHSDARSRIPQAPTTPGNPRETRHTIGQRTQRQIYTDTQTPRPRNQRKDINHAVESYRMGQTTGWRSAQLAGTSLWNFYKILNQRSVHIQYSENDLEEDLKALTGE